MGGIMNPQDSRDANDLTESFQAGRRGAAAMIPGAFEIRAPKVRPPQAAGVRIAHHAPAAAASDRERLEHEREGGGAPGERGGGRPGTIARVWRTVRHPMQLQDIWRRRFLHAE